MQIDVISRLFCHISTFLDRENSGEMLALKVSILVSPEFQVLIPSGEMMAKVLEVFNTKYFI